MDSYRLEKYYFEYLCYMCGAKLPSDEKQRFACRETSSRENLCSRYCLSLYRDEHKERCETFFSLEKVLRTALRKKNFSSVRNDCVGILNKFYTDITLIGPRLASSQLIIEMCEAGCPVYDNEVYNLVLGILAADLLRCRFYKWAERVMSYAIRCDSSDTHQKDRLRLMLAETLINLNKPQEALDIAMSTKIDQNDNRLLFVALGVKIESLAKLGQKSKALALYKSAPFLLRNKFPDGCDPHMSVVKNFIPNSIKYGVLLDVGWSVVGPIQDSFQACIDDLCDCKQCYDLKIAMCREISLAALHYEKMDLCKSTLDLFADLCQDTEKCDNPTLVDFNYVSGMHNQKCNNIEAAIENYMEVVGMCKHVFHGDYPLYQKALVRLQSCCSMVSSQSAFGKPPKKRQ